MTKIWINTKRRVACKGKRPEARNVKKKQHSKTSLSRRRKGGGTIIIKSDDGLWPSSFVWKGANWKCFELFLYQTWMKSNLGYTLPWPHIKKNQNRRSFDCSRAKQGWRKITFEFRDGLAQRMGFSRIIFTKLEFLAFVKTFPFSWGQRLFCDESPEYGNAKSMKNVLTRPPKISVKPRVNFPLGSRFSKSKETLRIKGPLFKKMTKIWLSAYPSNYAQCRCKHHSMVNRRLTLE